MKEEFSDLPGESLAILGYLWKLTEMFGNVSVAFGQFLENSWRSSKSGRSKRKIAINVVIIKITISSIVIGLKKLLFSTNSLANCYRTFCYWTVYYGTVQ